MNSDALYKNIGFVAVVVLFLYIVNKVVNLQNKTIEGLSMGGSSKKKSSRDDEEEDEEDDGKKKKKSSRSKDKDDESNLKDLLETLTDIGLDYEDNLNFEKNKAMYIKIMNQHSININYNMLSVILENAEQIEGNPDDAKDIMESLNTMKTYVSTLQHVMNVSR